MSDKLWFSNDDGLIPLDSNVIPSKHRLYVGTVQDVEYDSVVIDALARKCIDRPVGTFVEDFGGTACLSAAYAIYDVGFVENDKVGQAAPFPIRRCHAVDLDASYKGMWREIMRLADASRDPVNYLVQDVCSPLPADIRPDVIYAGNNSYMALKEPRVLREYFSRCRNEIAKTDGVFILDFFGGLNFDKRTSHEQAYEVRHMSYVNQEIEDDLEDMSNVGDWAYTYTWEHRRYNPITGHGTYVIHFETADGTPMHDAFVYEWRVYSLPEILDALRDVGLVPSCWFTDVDRETKAVTSYMIGDQIASTPSCFVTATIR